MGGDDDAYSPGRMSRRAGRRDDTDGCTPVNELAPLMIIETQEAVLRG